MKFTKTTMFHVHTYRCGHASLETEETYIKKAIELGATQIVFTDHCPFPGNPFPWRMDYEMLPDYVQTLKDLREKFKVQIDVKIGLEAEYFPSYDWYYKELLSSGDLDLLILGQHIYEHADGSFGYTDVDQETELKGFVDAMIQGMQSGFFEVLAHPDRPFTRAEIWDAKADALAKVLGKTALESGVKMEHNISSMKNGNLYRPEFWENISESVVQIYGLDAHSCEELSEYYKYIQQF